MKDNISAAWPAMPVNFTKILFWETCLVQPFSPVQNIPKLIKQGRERFYLIIQTGCLLLILVCSLLWLRQAVRFIG